MDTTVPELLDILKDHAMSVVARLKPSRRGYLNVVWADFGFKQLFDYNMEGVFKDQQHQISFAGGGT